jgi:aminoglycoside phosphotransferase
MSAILSRLDDLRGRIDLDRFDLGEKTSCVILTPRFRTSRHVVALLIPNGAGEPRFVVKMPRLAGDGEGIAREARALTALRENCPEAVGSIPEVVAWMDGDRPLLIETALVGPPLSRPTLRANPLRFVDEVVSWLMRLPRDGGGGNGSFERLISQPLALFAELFPDEAPERELVARTLEIVEPLRHESLPHIFEHGDLGHPNLILLPSGRVGVLDWELAEERGLLLHDLSFFLAFATFALRKSRTVEECVLAFDDAFFQRGGWARPRVSAYADGLELDEALLTPLFAACWARYTARLAVRIGGDGAGLTEESAAWVRENRYYGLWNHTLENVRDLAWRR